MTFENDNGKVTVYATGRIDANHAPQFAADMEKALKDAHDLVIDCRDLDYISSSGLRAVMLAVKTMAKQGEMRIVNVNKDIYSIFEMTGFTGVCEVEMPKK